MSIRAHSTMIYHLDLSGISAPAKFYMRLSRVIDACDALSRGTPTVAKFEELCRSVRHADFQAHHYGQRNHEPFATAQERIEKIARKAAEHAFELSKTSADARSLKQVAKALFDHAESIAKWLDLSAAAH